MKAKTETIWYLCVNRQTGGRIKTTSTKKKSQAHANADAQWYRDRKTWFLDVWLEKHEVTTAKERIEVVADGHED